RAVLLFAISQDLLRDRNRVLIFSRVPQLIDLLDHVLNLIAFLRGTGIQRERECANSDETEKQAISQRGGLPRRRFVHGPRVLRSPFTGKQSFRMFAWSRGNCNLKLHCLAWPFPLWLNTMRPRAYVLVF